MTITRVVTIQVTILASKWKIAIMKSDKTEINKTIHFDLTVIGTVCEKLYELSGNGLGLKETT